MRVTCSCPSWCWGMSPSESLTFLETVGPRVINNVMVLQVNRIFEFFNDYLLTIVRLPCKVNIMNKVGDEMSLCSIALASKHDTLLHESRG